MKTSTAAIYASILALLPSCAATQEHVCSPEAADLLRRAEAAEVAERCRDQPLTECWPPIRERYAAIDADRQQACR